ncbi:hypothetical protein [Microbacterium sp. Leaf436]|uniref:hypothetical protein n=1 Tax=Microbacterium sp. Leaf436 TaxID=1736377 RepID=UPI000AE7CBCC|nr:hypothetical protein [Microbacterium sp. Leaf436]
MKRGLVAAGAVALLLLTGCSAGEMSAQPVPTVTRTVLVPAPDYTPPDDAAVATEAGVSEFAVSLARTYNADAVDEVTPAQAQIMADAVCSELAAGQPPESVSVLGGITDSVLRGVLAKGIDSSYCQAP